ncbi:MAG: hypothetical protein JW918_05725 [Anaerolineae bacterium]|nr:hypothetical protein [Anaerolineae bacterium]
MVFFLGVLGLGMSLGKGIPRFDYVLIDSRRKVSLSRFQIILWTILVLSAYLAIAIPRALPGGLDTLKPEMLKECVKEMGAQEVAVIEERIAAAEKNVALAEENLEAAEASLEASEADLEASDEGSEEAEESSADVAADQERVATAEDVLAEAEAELAEAEAELETSEEATRECFPQALKITFPPELIAALGSSAASFAGSSLVKGIKKNEQFKKLSADIEALRLRVEEAKEKTAGLKGEHERAKVVVGYIDSTCSRANADLELAREKQKALEAEAVEAEKAVASAADSERPAAEAKLAEIHNKLTQVEEEINRLEPKARELERATLELKGVEGELEKATEEERKAREALKAASTNESLLSENATIKKASWIDMFRGEEKTNEEIVDVGKVQMFFFTIVVVFTYAVLLWTLLGEKDDLRHPLGVAFPAFTTSLNALLGISHAGYLTVKSVRTTPKEVVEEKPPEEEEPSEEEPER